MSEEQQSNQNAVGNYIAQAGQGGTASVNVTQLLNLSNISNAERRNRSKILAKVYRDWIEGVLENPNSLYNMAAIELGFEYKRNAVSDPWEMAVQESNTSHRELGSDVKISEVFDDFNGELLILGEPGSGKTTTLLDLARNLIIRAKQDDTFIIPVIFHLSFWSQNPIPFHDWLIYELGERYSLPPKIGKKWIESNQILPMLDGLDEVKPEMRSDCIEAINSFRTNYGLLNLVICSRTKEYEVLDKKLKLDGAILIQALTEEKIDDFLSLSGEKTLALKNVLEVDSELRELAKIPLMLNIMVMAYRKASISEISLKNSENKRTNIFKSYVDEMFRRRGKQTHYTPKQTILWLTWIANKMSQHNQSIFFIEHLKPNWLDEPQQKAYKWIVNNVLKSLMSLVVVSSIGGYFRIGWGLILGLCFFLLYKNEQEYEEIKIVGTLSWEWATVKNNFIPIFQNELIWLLLLLFISLLASKSPLTILGVGFILVILSSLTGVLVSGITGKDVEKRTQPNLGIFKSAFYGASVGIAKSLFMGFSGILLALVGNATFGANLSLIGCFFAWAFYGLLTGWLKYGGFTSLQHFILRLFLWTDRLSPWNYARFLDYATERIFLYKVGGGYMFIHRLPMEYFASLEAEHYSKARSLSSSRWRLKYYLLPSFVFLIGLLLSIIQLIPFAVEDFNLDNLKANQEKGEYRELVSNSDQMLKKNPKDVSTKARILIYRGYGQHELGNYQAAISDFRNARSLDIDEKLKLDALTNLAFSHISERNYDEAARSLDELVQKTKTDSDSIKKAVHLTNRAFLYNELKKYDKALSDSNEAIKIINSQHSLLNAGTLKKVAYTYSLLNQGRANTGIGKYDVSLLSYGSILIDLSTSDNLLRAYTFSYRAYTYAKLGKYDQALIDCKNFINELGMVDSSNMKYQKYQKAIAYNYCGLVYTLKKDYFGALDYYNKAIELDPKFGEVFENRGLTYSELKNREFAIRDLQTASQLYKIQGNKLDYQRLINTISYLDK